MSRWQPPAGDEPRPVAVDRRAIFAALDGTSLYYPGSGGDYRLPVRLFGPWVRTFWFVDIAYFGRRGDPAELRGLGRPADQVPPSLAGDARFALLSVAIEGPPSEERLGPHVTPCVRTERYRHLPSGRVVALKFRRGYGRSGFRKLNDDLGVFFYRRDSQGEGGSGNLWLCRESFDGICERLVNGGLVVTDGSNSGWPSQTYPELSRWRQRHDEVASGDLPGHHLAAHTPSFSTRSGHHVHCIGRVGRGYGPTLAWQVLAPRSLPAPRRIAEHRETPRN